MTTTELQRKELEETKLKFYKLCIFLPRFNWSFLDKPLDGHKSLVNFQSSEKVDFDHF